MLEITYELKDVIICALRYALGRKSYITSVVCEYIAEHPELIDKNVRNVMLKDLESLDDYYSQNDFIDRPIFEKLKDWLKQLEIGE